MEAEGGGGERGEEMGVGEGQGEYKERIVEGGGRMKWRQERGGGGGGGSLLYPQPALCTERCVPRRALLQVPTQRSGLKGQSSKVTTTLTSSSVWRSLGTDFDSFLTYRSVYCLHTSHMVT